MHTRVWHRLVRDFAVLALLIAAGCGGSPPQPKTDLSEQEKQQVRELNEQRMDEWGKKK